VGEVLDLTRYRAQAKVRGEKRLCIEISPTAFCVEQVEKGELKVRYDVFLERMIRDLLDTIE
jgi:hypothetical protein